MSDWRMTIITAILKMHEHKEMQKYILMFRGYSVKLIGLHFAPMPIGANNNVSS